MPTATFLRLERSSWWRNFFSDLEFRGLLDSSSELSKECLWYCFSPVIQKDLDYVKEQWNSHRIRKSRFQTLAGRPDSLFFLPEKYGGTCNLKMSVDPNDIKYVSHHVVVKTSVSEYQEYFEYAQEELSENQPSTWQEVLSLYKTLMQVA